MAKAANFCSMIERELPLFVDEGLVVRQAHGIEYHQQNNPPNLGEREQSVVWGWLAEIGRAHV